MATNRQKQQTHKHNKQTKTTNKQKSHPIQKIYSFVVRQQFCYRKVDRYVTRKTQSSKLTK